MNDTYNDLLALFRQAFAKADEVPDRIAVASIRHRLENLIQFCEYLASDVR